MLISENCWNFQELELEGWFCTKFVLPKVKSLKKLRNYLYFQYITYVYDLFKNMLKSMPDLQNLEYCFADFPSNDKILELLNRFCVNIEKLYCQKSDCRLLY